MEPTSCAAGPSSRAASPSSCSCAASPSSISLLDEADLLRRRPELFTMRNITLHERPRYLGVYFEMVFATGGFLECHITVGHWDRDAPTLSAQQFASLMNMITQVLRCGLQFSDTPAKEITPGGRCIVTIHVASMISSRWWGIQQSARSALKVQERSVFHHGTTNRRDNFHISVDARRP